MTTRPASANHDVGKRGEDIAAAFLIENGYAVVTRNFRCGKNEIDIVAEKNGVVSFIEVKTRLSDKFGSPMDAVTKTKQREIAKAADCYLQRHLSDNKSYRFDVVAVHIENNLPLITFIEDAFRIF